MVKGKLSASHRMKMNGAAVPQNKRDNPAFSSAWSPERFRKLSINPHISLPFRNQHFWQSIMAQTTHRRRTKFGYNDPHYGSTIGSYNKTVCKSEENARIMYWLSPLEPNTRHQTVRNDRFNGVGDWLLETCEFREWRESRGGADKAVLFCPGNPGVGKTYLR